MGKIIADKLNAKIKNHLWINIGGLIFDVKHKISGSGNTSRTINPTRKRENVESILE